MESAPDDGIVKIAIPVDKLRAAIVEQGGEAARIIGIVPMREMQSRYVAYVISCVDGDITKAAKLLGIDWSTAKKYARAARKLERK